jgi:hypothetical protein
VISPTRFKSKQYSYNNERKSGQALLDGPSGALAFSVNRG